MSSESIDIRMLLRITYNFIVFVSQFLWPIGGILSAKIRKINAGRKQTSTLINAFLEKDKGPFIWVHCASMGEWEQTIPVIRRLRQDTDYKILLSFYSPSGYEHTRESNLVDLKVYLPEDRPSAYQAAFGAMEIKALIFVRYDLWPNLIQWADASGILLMLIGAEFDAKHRYIQSKHSFFGSLLHRFSFIASNNPQTTEILAAKGLTQAVTTGSAKVARVDELKNKPFAIDALSQWIGGQRVVVAGSVWLPELEMIAQYRFSETSIPVKWIIAPHDISPEFLYKVSKTLGPGVDFYTREEFVDGGSDVLIIDTIGLLSGLYRYGELAIVGGGFGRGIHNILEPAAYGIPVISGPRNQKFSEAGDLSALGIYFPVQDNKDFITTLDNLLNDHPLRATAKQQSERYFSENSGAAERISALILKQIAKNA